MIQLTSRVRILWFDDSDHRCSGSKEINPVPYNVGTLQTWFHILFTDISTVSQWNITFMLMLSAGVVIEVYGGRLCRTVIPDCSLWFRLGNTCTAVKVRERSWLQLNGINAVVRKQIQYFVSLILIFLRYSKRLCITSLMIKNKRVTNAVFMV